MVPSSAQRPVKENGRLALLFRQRVERPSEGTEPCATNPSPQRVGVACQGGRCRSSACQYCIGGAGSLANGISLRGMNPMAWNAGGRWLSCTVPLRESRSTSARRCCPMWPDACGFDPRRGDHFGGERKVGDDGGDGRCWRVGTGGGVRNAPPRRVIQRDRTTGKPLEWRDGPVTAWKDTHYDVRPSHAPSR